MGIRKFLAAALLLWGALSLLPLQVRPLGVGDEGITYPPIAPADLLLLQARLSDPAPQWRRGALTVENAVSRVNFWILSDARPHWLLLPVGTLPFRESDAGLRVVAFNRGCSPIRVKRKIWTNGAKRCLLSKN